MISDRCHPQPRRFNVPQPVGEIAPADIVRFCGKVGVPPSKAGPSKDQPCWSFDGYANRKGYGQFKMGGRAHWAHRIAYRIWNGEIPPGMHVHHTCTNPDCVNPAHLMVMTEAENVAEANHRRGRYYCPETSDIQFDPQDEPAPF